MPLTSRQRQTLLWTAVGVAFLFLLWLLGPVLTPFVLGAVLAYMLEPGVEWLARRRVPRWIAVLLMIGVVIAVIVLIVLLVVPMLVKEAALVQQKVPALLDLLNTRIVPRINRWFGTYISLDIATMKEYLSEQVDGNTARSVLTSVRDSTGAVLGVLGTLFIVPVVLFFLLLDWPALLAHAERLVPLPVLGRTREIAREIDSVLAQFLRGQVSVMLALAIYYSAALALARFDVALPVGIITGLLAFIPYLGFTLGLVLALLAAIVQFGDWYGLIAVAVIYGVGQVIESFWLTPKLVGGSIGLHPLAVIFALMAFGQLFGFVGVLVALPVSAILLVALRRVLAHYYASSAYTG